MLGEALGGAQAHGKLEHLQGVEEGKSALAAARDGQAHHRSATPLLGLCDRSVFAHRREVFHPRRFDSFRTAHLTQVGEQHAGAFLLALDAHVQGLHGTGKHPCGVRVDHAAEERAELLHLGDGFCRA